MVTTLISVIGGAFLGVVALYALLYWLARRRRTPNWALDQECAPPIDRIFPTLAGLTHSRVYSGCAVEIFQNGSIFDEILADIAAAESTVHLETYLWETGELERRFADALTAAAARGVNVRMIVDDVGSFKRSSAIFAELGNHGIQLHLYSPLAFSSIHRFNERTHRKLLIVDGRIAYTMGHGIADQWLGDATDKDHFRDTGVRLRGPVAHGLQSVFASGWARETHELLCGDTIFPELEIAGDADIAVVSSTAGDSYSNVELAFTLAIAVAKKEILIQNPYFAPDQNVVELLCNAAERGVSVTLMLPGSYTDSYLLRLAARHLYPRLLRAGVSILEYVPTLSHQKVMLVDGAFARIGSTNFDSRSLELNAEAGVAILHPVTASALKEQFEEDRRACRPITLDDLKKVSLPARLWTAGVYLFRGHL